MAEHRARSLEKDLGLHLPRTGKDIYNAGGQFMIEMNLYNAGRPLGQLIDKVENTILAIEGANKQPDATPSRLHERTQSHQNRVQHAKKATNITKNRTQIAIKQIDEEDGRSNSDYNFST